MPCQSDCVPVRGKCFVNVCSTSRLSLGRMLTLGVFFAFRQKRQVEEPSLVPRKALKVSASSTAHRAVEAQTTVQRGAVSARADLEELVA